MTNGRALVTALFLFHVVAYGQNLDNGTVSLRFDARNGALVSLRDVATGYDLVESNTAALWEIGFMEAGSQPLRATDATQFGFAEHPGSSPSIELTWGGFADSGLAVTAHVSAPSGSSITEWRIRVDADESRPIDRVHFPRIAQVRSREREYVAVPIWMGEQTSRMRQQLNGADGEARRREWEYPGIFSMQFLAVYGGEVPGLYFATNDTDTQRKKFALFGDGKSGLGVEAVHLPEADAAQRGFESNYDCLVGPFSGDWFSAAERYRAWGGAQAWARESRLKSGAVPSWVNDTGIWVWNRGRSPGVLGPAAALQSAANLPVSVFWHWWHGCAYDTGFPEYLPPREGSDAFREAVASAHQNDLHAIVYMNQRLWGMRTESWTREGAERFSVKDANGKPHVEVYNIFTKAPCAPMCMGTLFWRDTYAGLAQRAILELGVDGIYMDQACASLSCYDASHGHAPGGGRFWMDGFRALTADIRSRCAEALSVTLAGEGCGEAWLPHLDLMLSLQVSRERYAAPGEWEPVPLFQAVYHDSAIQFGNYSSLTHPPYDDLWPAEFAPKAPLRLLDRKFAHQFRLEHARSFLWGQQITLANFTEEQLTERADEIAFIVRLARARRAARDFLQDGVMLRAPVFDAPTERIPVSRLSIYAGQQEHVKEYEMETPVVMGSAWKAPDGRIGVFLVNTASRRMSTAISATQYIQGPGSFSIRSEEGIVRSGRVDEDMVVRLDMQPESVWLVEFDGGTGPTGKAMRRIP
ncbi:MAG: hypothetical protein HUU46_20040 [Candidatus Hydrogenedentes bacterium]|nr:hypothetical protein [Candidatus Hydrogenedentota bacterium]